MIDCLYPALSEQGPSEQGPSEQGPEFRVILPTTRRFYYWELNPFFTLFNKYWGEDQEVVVLGDADPKLDYPNLTYFDMPPRFREDDLWIMHHFSLGLCWYFKKHIPEEYFVMLQTDFWLSAPVDLDGLRAVKRFMETRDDVIRVGICPWHGSATNNPYLVEEGELDGVTFYRCDDEHPDCFLQLSNIPAMWNRDLLHKVWSDIGGHDGWGCEGWGSDRLIRQNQAGGWKLSPKGEPTILRSLVAVPPALFWTHASYTRGQRVCLSRLPEEDRDLVRPFIPGGFDIQ